MKVCHQYEHSNKNGSLSKINLTDTGIQPWTIEIVWHWLLTDLEFAWKGTLLFKFSPSLVQALYSPPPPTFCRLKSLVRNNNSQRVCQCITDNSSKVNDVNTCMSKLIGSCSCLWTNFKLPVPQFFCFFQNEPVFPICELAITVIITTVPAVNLKKCHDRFWRSVNMKTVFSDSF